MFKGVTQRQGSVGVVDGAASVEASRVLNFTEKFLRSLGSPASLRA